MDPFLPCDFNLRENPYEKVTYKDPVTMEGMLSRVVSQITLNMAYIFNDATLQSQTYGTGVASQPVHNGFSYEKSHGSLQAPRQAQAAVAHYLAQECVQGTEG